MATAATFSPFLSRLRWIATAIGNPTVRWSPVNVTEDVKAVRRAAEQLEIYDKALREIAGLKWKRGEESSFAADHMQAVARQAVGK